MRNVVVRERRKKREGQIGEGRRKVNDEGKGRKEKERSFVNRSLNKVV
jgi:hypothetical protein